MFTSPLKSGGILVSLILFLTLFSYGESKVSLSVNGLAATVQNDKIKIAFKKNAMVSSVNVNGKNIASTSENSFYLDWNSNGQGVFNPSKITVVENTDSRAHWYWTQEGKSGVFQIELHYLLANGQNGIYSWAKYRNTQGSTVSLGETRTVYRFNPSILTKAANGVRTGTLYTYSYLNSQTKIQDETWKLPDGSYYTKYDYSGYIRETPYQGVYGNGYGAFVISASREYHGGGPLKQDLLVHQDSLITNYFVSSHFGTKGLSAPSGRRHIYGPWLIYFPTGSDYNILSDVQSKANQERSAWPYNFVNDNDYPTNRGTVSGTIAGQKKATVILYDSTSEEFSVQALGYLYTTNTDNNGGFTIKNIRPGNYKLVAYPIDGQGSDSTVTATVSVAAGNHNIGNFNLKEPSNIMWSIGKANRRSSEFKYSKELRNYVWETLPPASLTFTVGSSNEANDWYYAQSKPGTWTIHYQDTADGKGRTLRVALAAESQSPHLIVYVNNHKVGDVYYGNDQAIYRSAMQSGTYYSNVFTINSAQVVSGTNELRLQLSKGQLMYDAISLQRN